VKSADVHVLLTLLVVHGAQQFTQCVSLRARLFTQMVQRARKASNACLVSVLEPTVHAHSLT
jgi:hypothetical protein